MPPEPCPHCGGHLLRWQDLIAFYYLCRRASCRFSLARFKRPS